MIELHDSKELESTAGHHFAVKVGVWLLVHDMGVRVCVCVCVRVCVRVRVCVCVLKAPCNVSTAAASVPSGASCLQTG